MCKGLLQKCSQRNLARTGEGRKPATVELRVLRRGASAWPYQELWGECVPQNRPDLRRGSWRRHNSHTSVTGYLLKKSYPGDHKFPPSSGSLCVSNAGCRGNNQKTKVKNHLRGSEGRTNIQHVTKHKFPITSHRIKDGSKMSVVIHQKQSSV